MSRKPQTFSAPSKTASVPADDIIVQKPVPSPSQSIVAERPVFEVRDGLGRLLRWRAPSVLDQIRLMRAISGEHSSNEAYVNAVSMSVGVFEIEGIPVSFPKNEAQIDALVGRIGDHGFLAIQAYMQAEKARAIAEAAALIEDQDSEE